MSQVPDQDLVAAVAGCLVERVAPEERPLFPAVSRAYFARPDAVAPPGRARPDPLAFGLEGADWLITPAILAAATEVVRFLFDALKDAARPEIAALIRRCFARGTAAPAPPEATPPASSHPTLTPAQIVRLRDVIHDRAAPLLPDEDKAGLLADAVIGALTLPAD